VKGVVGNVLGVLAGVVEELPLLTVAMKAALFVCGGPDRTPLPPADLSYGIVLDIVSAEMQQRTDDDLKLTLGWPYCQYSATSL
jgi:hypothetical protein